MTRKKKAPRIVQCVRKRYYPFFDFTLGYEPQSEDYIIKRDRITAQNRDFPFETLERNGKKFYLGEIRDSFFDANGREITVFRESLEQKIMTSIVYIDRPGLPSYRVEIRTDGQVDFYELIDSIQGDFPNISYKNGRLTLWDEDEGGRIYSEFHEHEHLKLIEQDEWGNMTFGEFTDGEQGFQVQEYTYA